MRFTRVGEQILRCKICRQHPKYVSEKRELESWGGSKVSYVYSKFICDNSSHPLIESFDVPASSASQAMRSAIFYWNYNYGK